MSSPLISVIIPCYNVEKFLDKCVESVVGQTYQNLEIFLVDDGATDATSQMCDEWGIKDSRIKVIHKTNGGLSDARNVAIDVSTGDYLLFIDSDDYVPLDHVEFLYDLLVRHNSDISVCSWCSFYEGETPIDKKSNISEVCMSSDESIALMFYQKNFDNTAWGKLYKHSLFDDVRYPVGLIYEDLATTYKLFAKSKSVAFSTEKKYYYLLRSNSLVGCTMNTRRYESSVEILKKLTIDKENFSYEVRKSFNCRILSFAFHILLQLPSDDTERQNEMMQYIKQNRFGVILNSRARIKSRVASILSFGGIRLINIFKKYGLSR